MLLGGIGVTIGFPAAAAGEVAARIFDKAHHIVKRIAQKYADFMGKIGLAAEPAGQLLQKQRVVVRLLRQSVAFLAQKVPHLRLGQHSAELALAVDVHQIPMGPHTALEDADAEALFAQLFVPAADAAGKVELAAADVSALGEDAQAKDSAKLAGKAPEYYIQPYNLLDNSDFVHPVAQAGVNGAHGATKYAVDRWEVTTGATVSQVADGLKIVSDKTSWTAGIQQKIEAKRFADVMTLAVHGIFPVACRLYAYIGSGTVDFGDPGYFQGDPVERTLVLKLTKPDGLTGDEVVNVYISPDTGSTGTAAVVRWAALYEGEYTAETVPPYVPKGYAAELAECLRYYRKIKANNETFSGYAASGVAYALIPLQTMRIAPTVTGSGKFYYTLGNAQGTTTETATAHNANANRVVVKCAVSVTGICTGVITPQGDIDISADL